MSAGRGFRQSYLFAGGHGSGKTTLGRILGRALLCESPVQGAPCDLCFSCKSLLETGSSADFSEVDAATNSGKANMLRITEELQFQSFSGKRRIYLFDEAHQLSTEALDALLKPLEDNVLGTDDKKLVCIFCTTEPEKMRATVLSRCAPAFVVRPQTPAVIAKRLAWVCEQEGVGYELDALQIIAEITECHVRDALKAVEGVSMLGGVNVQGVSTYLHLDLNVAYLDVLDAIGTDLRAALSAVGSISQRVSPRVCYERLADLAMLAFRASLGDSVPVYWNAERVAALSKKGTALLGYAARFSSRPAHPTASMLLCDIAHLHHAGGSVQDPLTVISVVSTAPSAPPNLSVVPSEPTVSTVSAFPAISVVSPAAQILSSPTGISTPNGKIKWDPVLGEIPQRAVRRENAAVGRDVVQRGTMSPDMFGVMLGNLLAENGST